MATHSVTLVPSTSVAQVPATPAAGAIARGMGLSGVVVYTATTDPNHLLGRQGEYTSKASWAGYANDNASGGGSIEVFANVADAQARLTYLQAFKPPFGDGYDYLAGTALLRLSADYTPGQAQTIRAAFDQAAS